MLIVVKLLLISNYLSFDWNKSGLKQHIYLAVIQEQRWELWGDLHNGSNAQHAGVIFMGSGSFPQEKQSVDIVHYKGEVQMLCVTLQP